MKNRKTRGVHVVTSGRTLADALREVAASMNFETLLGGEPLRHDRNAVRIARRLVLAEARSLERARLPTPVRFRSMSLAERRRIDGDDRPIR